MQVNKLAMCRFASMWIRIPICFILAIQLFNSPSIAQQKGAGKNDSVSENAVNTVIPGEVPTSTTTGLVFQDASDWAIQQKKKGVPDFVNLKIERVEVFGDVNRELFELVASLPHVRSLRVVEPPTGIEFQRVIQPISTMRNLESMELELVEVSPRGCAFISGLVSLREFRCDMLLSDADIRTLGKLPNLTELNITSVTELRRIGTDRKPDFLRLKKLSVHNIKAIEHFKEAPQLVRVSVASACTVADTKFIAENLTPTHLKLSVKSLDAISPLFSLGSLKVLTVEKQVTDEQTKKSGAIDES